MEKLKVIADNYGYEAQARQLTEEMAELTVALNKEWRGNKGYMPCDDHVARQKIIEEIADVENVLEQLKYLIDCGSEVFLERIKKTDREIVRIKTNGKSV